jgi:hypothetical protein
MIGFPKPLDYSDEIWRQVPSAPMYDVSSFGRVRSWVQKGGPLSTRGSRRALPTMLRQQPRGRDRKSLDPYLVVELHQKPFQVHRLVLLAFMGPCPDGHEAAHGNGRRSDNRLSNLTWATKAKNTADKYIHGTDPKTIATARPDRVARGEQTGHAKLTTSQVREIRQMYPGRQMREIAAIFGVSSSLVSCIILRKSWRHVA